MNKDIPGVPTSFGYGFRKKKNSQNHKRRKIRESLFTFCLAEHLQWIGVDSIKDVKVSNMNPKLVSSWPSWSHRIILFNGLFGAWVKM